ncbi:MAG: iron-sulfur cluster repair di-iron protein [Balneolaceae bacterium]|nr:iron-sulfur cluster repair di-iron protein [Balneolaceae bacterium]
MTNTKERTVGEIVADDYRAAGVFKKYGLDFCCGGGKSLADACERKGLNAETLLQEIEEIIQENDDRENYNDWSPSFLIDYIVNNHHYFVRTKLPEIKAYAEKVAKVHGKTYPVLNEMLGTFLVLKDEMLSHLDAEESILFPYVKKLCKAKEKGKKPAKELQSSTAAQAIAMMEKEHEEAGELMARLEEMSNGFNPPEDACTTFRVYFKNLKGFQEDLHKHVHLENNILFPKALEMERALN